MVYVYRRFRIDTMFLNASHQIVNIVTLFQTVYNLTWPTFSHQNIKVQTYRTLQTYRIWFSPEKLPVIRLGQLNSV